MRIIKKHQLKTSSILMVALLVFCSCSRFSTQAKGRITVSAHFTGSTYYNGGWHSTSTYYIQKGNEERKILNGRNLIAAVKDNPSALSHARIYKFMRTSTIVIFLTTFIGTTYGILGRDSNPKLAKSALTVGLLSLPPLFITTPLGNRHAKKAIKTYNEF